MISCEARMNKYVLLLSSAALTASLLSACSDDSSSGSNPATPTAESSSSPIAVDPTSSAITPESSASLESSASIASSSDATPAAPVTEITYDEFGFVDIQPVFMSIQPNEKAIFILRHGEREAKVTKQSKLTEDGIEQALSVGQKLISDEEIYFLSTDFVRTKMTCEYIAQGRGQTTFPYDTSNIFTKEAFVKDSDKFTEYNSIEGNSNKMTLTKWAYNGDFADAFYDLGEACEKVINEAFSLVKGRINVIGSHDEFVTPLIVYLSEGKADLRIFEEGKNRHWINFLAGAAIIVDDQGNRRAYPIKGLADAHE